MFDFWLDAREAADRYAGYWWLMVLGGVAWMLFALVVFRFSWVSVLAISVLFGTIAIVAGVSEFAMASMSAGAWKVLRYILGVVFIAIGVVAYFSPGNTFVALAAVVGFFFLVSGVFDIVSAITTRSQTSAWWFQLLVGVAEVALGFWAAGNWSRSVALLVAWVGATAIFQGISMIVFGLKLHQLHERLEEAEATPREERRERTVPTYGT